MSIVKSFQKGVIFESDNSRYFGKIRVEPDVHELHFAASNNLKASSNLNFYRLGGNGEVFPQVDTLVIEKGVSHIAFPNTMLPNVKKVISNGNKKFLSGDMLIQKTDSSVTLFNTFCKDESEVIDLKGVTSIMGKAFAGCKSGNVINADKIELTEMYAFADYPGMSKLPRLEGGAHILGNILMDYQEEIPDSIERLNRLINFSGKTLNAYLYLIQQITDTYTPKKICVKDEGVLDLKVLLMMLSRSRTEAVEIVKSNPYFKTYDGILYTHDMKRLIRCPGGRTGHVVIPDGVEEIESNAFFGCRQVTEIIMPDSVVAAGVGAFSNCISLEKIKYSKNLKYITERMFSSCASLKLVSNDIDAVGD